MLTISKVFIFLCLLCLYENREYPSSFQNKSVSLIAQVYSVPGQTEGRREAFLEWTSKYLSFKPLSLTCEGNVNYCKNVHHLGETEGERKAFSGGCKKGGHIVRLPPRALGCHKRWKSLSFCEIWNNPTPPLFFIRPPYK